MEIVCKIIDQQPTVQFALQFITSLKSLSCVCVCCVCVCVCACVCVGRVPPSSCESWMIQSLDPANIQSQTIMIASDDDLQSSHCLPSDKDGMP